MKIESPGPVVQTSSFQPEQAIEVQLHTEIFLQTQSFTDSSDNFHEMVRWNTLEHCCLKTHHVAARCQGGLLGIAAAVKQEKLRKSWARFYSGRSTIFTAFTATLRAFRMETFTVRKDWALSEGNYSSMMMYDASGSDQVILAKNPWRWIFMSCTNVDFE